MTNISKSQQQIINRAIKNNFSKEQIEILSIPNTVEVVKNIYNLFTLGVPVSEIDTLINNHMLFNRALNLLPKYSADEIVYINNKSDSFWTLYYFMRQYKVKNINLLLEYDEFLDKFNSDEKHSYTTSLDNEIFAFMINNNVPTETFKEKYLSQYLSRFTDNGYLHFDHSFYYHEEFIPGIMTLIPETMLDNTAHFNTVVIGRETDFQYKEIIGEEEMLPLVREFSKLSNITELTVDTPSCFENVTIRANCIDIKLNRRDETILRKKRNTKNKYNNDLLMNSMETDEEALSSYMYDLLQPYNTKPTEHLIIFYDGGYYFESRNKLYPLSIKHLSRIWKRYGKHGKTLCEFILKNAENKLNSPVCKDILRTIKESDGTFLVPIVVNECRDMHNYNQLFRSKYAEADKINWNKTDVNLGYLILKSLRFLNESDQRKLLQVKDRTFVDNYMPYNSFWWHNSNVFHFLAELMKVQVNAKNDNCNNYMEMDFHQLFVDYCTMQYEMHKKININFKTEHKVCTIHDEVTKEYNKIKHTHKVRIPKNSKFNNLRKLLPPEFEWIRTGKRLLKEGIEMHHCVNSYHTCINRDTCAIYSFEIDGTRYTAEFGIKNGKYTIRQIKGKHNAKCPAEVKKKIEKMIRNAA